MITLSEETINNLKSIEYKWVKNLHIEGYPSHEINYYIQACFGGDEIFADLFRRVALDQESIYVLKRHLGWAPSCRELS